MEKIEFTWMGLQLQEPMSLILNWVLAAFCFYFFNKLNKVKADVYSFGWTLFFLFMAVSAFFGGLAHFFSFYAEYPLKIITWSMTSLAVFSAEISSLTLIGKKSPFTSAFKIMLCLKLALIVFLALWYFDFRFIKINTAIGMLGITAIIHYIHYVKTKVSFPKFVVFGILWLILPALVHGLNINPHLWFNRDDLSHVLIIISFVLFHRGVSLKLTEANSEHLVA